MNTIVRHHAIKTTIFLTLVSTLLSGCGANKNKQLIDNWSNESALRVYVKSEYVKTIEADIDQSFGAVNYKYVFATEKSSKEESLSLLFIFNSSDDKTMSRSQLLNDERISSVHDCFDLPFETIDNRYIHCEKNTISVGEVLDLEIKGGAKSFYIQPFSFSSFMVETDLTADGILRLNKNVCKIEKINNGWFVVNTKTNDYFNLITTIDEFARNKFIDSIEFDRREVVCIPPPSWTISDDSIIEIIKIVESDYFHIQIRGLSKGTAIIELDGVSCSITVE